MRKCAAPAAGNADGGGEIVAGRNDLSTNTATGGLSKGAQLPEQYLVEEMAEAAYLTHHRPPAPVWKAASEEVREWVRAQMRAALARLRELEGQDK